MKNKLNFLIVFTLLVILVGANTGTVMAQDVVTITIGPDTLVAEYETMYSQQLEASGGTEPYSFSLSNGSLPAGISLSDSGLLSGFPDGINDAIPGTYPITIKVEDSNHLISSRDYDFVLDKGTPSMEAGAQVDVYWNNPFNLWASVTKETGLGWAYLIPGTVGYSIDGNIVEGCEAMTNSDNNYLCTVNNLILSVGTHTFEANFTPLEFYRDYYEPANVSGTFTVKASYYAISGEIFRDQNQNGIKDNGEYSIGEGWTVSLDQGCDGTVDKTTTTALYWGSYQFFDNPGGECYRVTVIEMPGWQQTTQLEDFWLNNYVFSKNIGFYYPTITLSPTEIPSGNVGQEYSQTFTASGGAEPYIFTIADGNLPDGLTFSQDGTLSGTPTATSSSYFMVQAEDANHATGYSYYDLSIKTDGIFTFTSSSNPSVPGDPVTFTVSATGDVIEPDYGTIPPIGSITFFADGNIIEGCSNLNLNFAYDEYGDWLIGDYPAVCTTATLEMGTHQITAELTEYTGDYNIPTLSLTQDVQSVTSADLSIGMTDSKDPIKLKAKLIYTITVTNSGLDTAENIILVDTLDRNTTYVSTSAPKGWTCTYANSAVTCTSDNLSSGSSAVIKITVIVKKTAPVGKNLVNNANVTSTTYDPNLINNSVVEKTKVIK